MVKFTGIVDFVTLAAYLIIFGFFWRTTAARLSDKPIGQAMAFIF
jgi:hypothetical protein